MIIDLLKKSDWAFLLDFVSPAFFKVIPPLQLLSNATAMAKRTQDKGLYHEGLAATQQALAGHFPELEMVPGHMGPPAAMGVRIEDLSEDERRMLARGVVEIYFSQILLGQTVFLDLRLSRFSYSSGKWTWSPAPLLGVFEPVFLRSMAELYEGFYGNRPEQMRAALKQLGMDWAFDVFMEHFGEGDQTAVHFTMSHFVQTFHEIFMKCKEEKRNLKGEFVQLGVILGLMYESLERLNVPVDVRGAYARVAGSKLKC
jgi:hypothetical protein